ncbi:MAG TPA: glycosyltransferase family 39 protein [Terriglobales bacterium]
MLRAAKEFKIGRPQVFAGLMLLAFLAQCLWSASSRHLSELEYQYIASGFSLENPSLAADRGLGSPMTAWIAGWPVRLSRVMRSVTPASLGASLAIPRPWFLRLPFVVFGVWLGGAVWWVARRLFDDAGGYVALALYCSSPAMVMISSNVGPEIILAWSSFGLIYTAIGVAHTLYAPPHKWAPRVVILGLSVGFALATAWWSFVLVLLAFAFMIYLAPGRRHAALLVLLGASVIALAVAGFVTWATGSAGLDPPGLLSPRPTIALLHNAGFALNRDTDGYVLIGLFIAALATWGSWRRARYFGNTAPLLTAFATVLLFTLVPSLRIWDAVLGLSFLFLFIGGVAADLLETSRGRLVAAALTAGILLRLVLGLRTVWIYWVGQNPV